jgi:hypothetical protein
MARENVALIVADRETRVALDVGAVAVTVGGGGGAAVVNVQVAGEPRGVPSLA